MAAPETEPAHTIRAATKDDLAALLQLRRYAESWLRKAGIEQWTDHDRGDRAIRAGVHDGTTHVVLDTQDDIVASLTLAGPDPDFWGPDDDPDSGLYLYKFMVGAAARGTGLGETLLDWAGQQAQSQGKEWLRLDCWRTNTGLQSYYARHGFQHVRTMTVAGRNSGALMQRPSALRTGTGFLPRHR